MLDKTKLQQFIEDRLADTDCFLTDLSVSSDNRVVVEIDSDSSVDIDFCVRLSHDIEEAFPTDDEDYELEVGSAGLTAPFKCRRQFIKNIGNEVEVLAADSKKYVGTLKSAGENEFTVAVERKVKKEGEKRPVLETVDISFPYDGTRRVTYLLKF